jgi:MFS family permease
MTLLTRSPESVHTEALATARRNFWGWVLYQLLYRIGWQFKMESTMVAGLVGYLSPPAAAAMIMGLFTTVNNVGRCVAPALMAPVVERWPSKRNAVLAIWAATVASWAVLAVFLWTPAAQNKPLALGFYLATYTLFFGLLGAGDVARGALLGKIIAAEQRGRALGLSVALSGPINMGAIWTVYWLVHSGRFPAPRSYALSFTLTVVCFTGAGLALLRVRERPSPPSERKAGLAAHWQDGRRLLRRSANFRRLAAVNLAMAVSGGLLGFYTTYGRRMGVLDDASIILATLYQVVFQAGSSSIFGRMADARGNRIAICLLLWAEAAIPLIALATGGWLRVPGLYMAVYALIGFRFPLFQLVINYLLEIVPERDHSLALGLTNTLTVVTVPAPLLFGLAANHLGYGPVLTLVAATVAMAALAALRLEEPRQWAGDGAPG